MRIVFLLEEPSAARFLEQYLPRWKPDLQFLCIPHQGKSDLDKSIPRKLRAWQDPEAHFVVMRDNDGQDCLNLKGRLRKLCDGTGKSGVLVRLACQELDAWYLGDLKAVGEAFGRPELAKEQGRAKFREPDKIASPSRELARLVPYQKVQGSKALGTSLELAIENNRSHSFRVFFQGLENLISEAS